MVVILVFLVLNQTNCTKADLRMPAKTITFSIPLSTSDVLYLCKDYLWDLVGFLPTFILDLVAAEFAYSLRYSPWMYFSIKSVFSELITENPYVPRAQKKKTNALQVPPPR